MGLVINPDGVKVGVSDDPADNGTCQGCGVFAWLDKGLCEHCFDLKYNKNAFDFPPLTEIKVTEGVCVSEEELKEEIELSKKLEADKNGRQV